MTHFTLKLSAAGTAALIAAMPALAQDDVQLLSTWEYEPLYADGWSVDRIFDTTVVVDSTDADIGDVENIIFSNDGAVLGIIAEVGGFWDIGDTHVLVPWSEVIATGIDQFQVPVTEETVLDYDIFGKGWFDEQVITVADSEATQEVDDDLVAGAGIFKATDLMGDYVYIEGNMRYGYVSDLIIQGGAISAIVTDAAAYGRGGYYAYPYAYRGDMMSPRYDLPYDATEVGSIENFDYDRIQSGATQ